MDERWYAVAVHARQERAASAALSDRGFEVFLPTRRIRRAWSDRIKHVEAAIFPGYLFVRTAMNADRRLELLKVRLAVDLVGRLTSDRVAQHVPDIEIESLKKLIADERELDPIDTLTTGTLVAVVSGPLKGARGVVQRGPDGRRRLVVQLELLGRGVATALSADDVVDEAS